MEQPPQGTPLIWRDDDVGYRTKLEHLREVNDVLTGNGLLHTVAVIASELASRPDLVEFVIARGMDVQLHCWNHEDLTQDWDALCNIEIGVAEIQRVFVRRPTVLYPPWNRTNNTVNYLARRLGLRVSNQKISLSQVVRAGGDVAEEVVNFHHWYAEDRAILPRAAETYRRWHEEHRLSSADGAVRLSRHRNIRQKRRLERR